MIGKKITKKTELCVFFTRQKGCKSLRHAYNLNLRQVGRQSSASTLVGLGPLVWRWRTVVVSLVTYLQTCWPESVEV